MPQRAAAIRPSLYGRPWQASATAPATSAAATCGLLRNMGTTTWDSNYALAFHSGNPFGAGASVSLPVSVKPGESIPLGLTMVAPEEPGTYRSTWMMRNSQGQFFPGEIYTEIVVHDVNAPVGRNMARWVDQYQKHLAKKKSPRYWRLHNYLDANRMRTTGTRTLLGHTKGQIWFTETGGIVKRKKTKNTVSFPESAAHAAKATRWVFDKLVPLSRRITRVYLYQWNSLQGENWDSGLISPTGKSRPSIRTPNSRSQTARSGTK